MKRWILFLSGQCLVVASVACDVCKKQQPKALRGWVHGGGPGSDWDYVIVVAMVAFVLASAYYSVKWLVSPGEKKPDHIKYSILAQRS